MAADPMNIPPVSIAAAKAALIEQYADPLLRRRATMLWGTRGVGKSSIVQQVAQHFGVPLVDLRLTTIEPVDIRGAIYADERRAARCGSRRSSCPRRASPRASCSSTS
jgi:MoxR-like ATPase